MSNTRDKIKVVLENTEVEHIGTIRNVERLADELVDALVPQEKENVSLQLIAALQGTMEIPVFNNASKKIGTAEVVDGHFKVSIDDNNWPVGRMLNGVRIFVDWGKEE